MPAAACARPQQASQTEADRGSCQFIVCVITPPTCCCTEPQMTCGMLSDTIFSLTVGRNGDYSIECKFGRVE